VDILCTVLNYVIRNIPPELWRQVKQGALNEDRSVRAVVIELLTQYAAHVQMPQTPQRRMPPRRAPRR
jgi:hypothetical protein